MPKIRLTEEALMERAAEVRRCQEEQNQVITKVQGLINELVAGWKGPAQQAFEAAFNSKKGTYDKFRLDLEKFAAFLDSYARTMVDVDTGEATRITGAAN